MLEMSAMEAVDPYEQQLLAVFESCDDFCQGSLGPEGLYQLCEKLQLEDHYAKLVRCLQGDSKGKRVTFYEFREGLLKLLNSSDCDDKSGGGISPAREVSPKYVFGKKKYGRRSRPESIEIEGSVTDETDDAHCTPPSCSTDNDSDVEESVPKKRRARASKRKEVKTERTEDKCEKVASPSISSTTNEEECLIAAWATVSTETEGSLTRDELVRVFQCIGLESGSEEAAMRVFEKLEFEESDRITLQGLLELIRSGVSWMKDVRTQHLETDSCPKSTLDFGDSLSSGYVTGASIVEQWEAAGVPCAKQLLHNLGHSTSQQVDVASLVTVLSEELKGLGEEGKASSRNLDPHIALLQASLVLENIYVQCLKTTMEHMTAEKEKLRNDVLEANQRALLLAQEVDDHHSKLELSTQQQVKILEQKHAEKIRELTLQIKTEQDSLIAQNAILERRVSSLEGEESKYKGLITQMEVESRLMEQEHRIVVDQLASMQVAKEKLEKDLESLSTLQEKVAQMESTLNDSEVISLLERIHTLEAENTNLRDRNDELSMEVEELSAKLSNTFIKKRSSPNHSLYSSVDESMEEGSVIGNAIKRRGDSFILQEAAEDSEGDEGSPRLGKVRKCSHAKDFVLTTTSLQELQIGQNLNRGESAEDDSSDNLSTPTKPQDVDTSRTEEDHSLDDTTPFSGEIQEISLSERGMNIEVTTATKIFKEMQEKLAELENVVGEDGRSLVESLQDSLTVLSKSSKKEMVNVSLKQESEVDVLREELVKSKEEYEKEQEKLKSRCSDLESSLELLRVEYEKTEDYWAEKLEEERTLFEMEHKQSDEKYSELVEKIMEYEEMLTIEREQKPRLETIDERVSFEKQVADMEEECCEMKANFTKSLKEKELELDELRRELLLLKSRGLNDASVQVSISPSSDNFSEPSKKVVSNESTKKCKSYNKRSFTFSSGDRKMRYCVCCRNNPSSKLLGDLRNLQETKSKYEREIEMLINERNVLYKDIADRRRELSNYMTGNTMNGLSSEVEYLEQRCHGLVVTLKQQQKQTEEILRSTWKQHKAEVKDLKSVLKVTEDKLKQQTMVIQDQLSKLARTDMLVKDLFVENAYLISSVQKLEQQCHTYSPSKHSV